LNEARVFYESIGVLLGRSAEALAAADPDRPQDHRDRRQDRQITTLLRRISVIWPELFRTLDEETSILEATLRDATRVVQAHRLTHTDASMSEPPNADPLMRYRQVLCDLDELVILLHGHVGEAWARDALSGLRRGLGDAVEAQSRLVEKMLGA